MNHQYYMQKALDLALKGWLRVAPNPMVGAVIVKNEEIVASGYHQQYGGPHAEVNAVNSLPPGVDPSDCTLYVTLEPCSHHGKTPPCADLLVSKGFKEVVIACEDPNPLVAGKGTEKLKVAGISVITGVLEQEARQVNKRFICFHEKQRPFITLKWAITADGFISRDPLPADRKDNLITGPEAGLFVHQLRAGHMAILVGKNTILNDNPLLTTRLIEGKNPIRIFLDRQLQVPRTARIFGSEAPTWIFNELKEGKEDNVEYIRIGSNEEFISFLLKVLKQRNVQSLMVEGGRQVLNDFMDRGLWDEAFVLQNPALNFGNGIRGVDLDLGNEYKMLGNDRLFTFLKQN